MTERHEYDLPSRFAVFNAKNGKPEVVARFENDDVWLTQEALACLYKTTKQNISQHLKSIFESGELDRATKVKKFFTMGKNTGQVAERPVYHYCLDVIIALGYRIDSPVANNEKPNVGMTSFRGDYVTKDDVRIAKNYLTENELSRLNLLVSQFLDFAEYKALSEEPMSMADWIAALDDQLMRFQANLLVGKGSVTHDEAIAKAESEFEIYRVREMRQLKSDFDKAIREYLPDGPNEEGA